MRELINQLRERRLAAYTIIPRDISDHFEIEQHVQAGGYGYRQILELVQNGADAILEARETNPRRTDPERIEVVLKGKFLYVANTGAPLTQERNPAQPWKEQAIGCFTSGDTIRTDGPENINLGEQTAHVETTAQLTERLRAGQGKDGDLPKAE